MVKKLLLTLGVIVAVFGVSQNFTTQSVSAQSVNLPTYFCHRSNSASNPYQSVPFSQTFSEIDGVGNNDHSQHTGPVVTTEAQAAALKQVKIDWGDIIPPVPGFLEYGLNWDAAGQAVYYADCDFPDFDDEDYYPEIYFDVSCNQENTGVVVTVVNIGGGTGYVDVNDESIEVESGATVTRTFELGGRITIDLNDEGGPVYDAVPVCESEEPELPVGGRGSGTITPAATQPFTAVVLPRTSGANYAVVIGTISATTALLSIVTKKLYTKFF